MSRFSTPASANPTLGAVNDAHHPPFPFFSAPDSRSSDRVRDALADADTVDGFGTDVGATLHWARRTGESRPETLAATWDLLAATAMRDVTAARILEPHLDALGILTRRPRPASPSTSTRPAHGASSPRKGRGSV